MKLDRVWRLNSLIATWQCFVLFFFSSFSNPTGLHKQKGGVGFISDVLQYSGAKIPTDGVAKVLLENVQSVLLSSTYQVELPIRPTSH